jgi:hypothetical protein
MDENRIVAQMQAFNYLYYHNISAAQLIHKKQKDSELFLSLITQ